MIACCRPTAFAAQLDVLANATPAITALIDRHVAARHDWWPGELVDFGDDPQLAALGALRERARGLPAAVKVSVMLNLLTEEGLPHFHRIIAEHVGSQAIWQRWTRLWTAEEDRHGNVLRDYARDAALFAPAAIDRLQFGFLRDGFDPEWAGSPYRLLAYTSLQERATQISHANTARLAAAHEPLLQTVLARLAGDEARHCAFYRDAFALALAADPDEALLELADVAPALSMPGSTILGFQMMAEVERQAGVFGPRQYAALIDESLTHWGIARIEPRGGEARRARDRLMALPARLDALAGRLEQRRHRKTFAFDFLRPPLAALA